MYKHYHLGGDVNAALALKVVLQKSVFWNWLIPM